MLREVRSRPAAFLSLSSICRVGVPRATVSVWIMNMTKRFKHLNGRFNWNRTLIIPTLSWAMNTLWSMSWNERWLVFVRLFNWMFEVTKLGQFALDRRIRSFIRSINRRNGIAMVYLKQEKFPSAEFHFSKATQLFRTNPDLMCHLAVVRGDNLCLLTLVWSSSRLSINAIDPRTLYQSWMMHWKLIQKIHYVNFTSTDRDRLSMENTRDYLSL